MSSLDLGSHLPLDGFQCVLPLSLKVQGLVPNRGPDTIEVSVRSKFETRSPPSFLCQR